MMRIYLCTCVGIGKNVSDDRVLIGHGVYSDCTECLTLESGCIAVADGVGGNQAGDIAAMLACTELAKMEKPSVEGFQKVNARLLDLAQSSSLLSGMATTISGIWVGQSSPITDEAACATEDITAVNTNIPACLMHVGNTRVYAIQAGNYLRQMTEDDTVVEYLLKSGKLSEEEAFSYAGRNEITACLGGGRAELNKLRVVPLPDGEERFMLTSDGVHETLNLDEMEDIIADKSGEWLSAVKTLVGKAQEKGTNDDCTAVIVETNVLEEAP